MQHQLALHLADAIFFKQSDSEKREKRIDYNTSR